MYGIRHPRVILKAALWISLWLMLFAAGCGSDEPTPAADASPATTAATTETSPGSVGESAIVGRWQRVHKCGELLNALDKAGLREVAPRIVGEEYFPDVPAAELAQKDELCEGAKSPFVHSHFFDGVGRFGSLDENENQVDEGGTRSSTAGQSVSAATTESSSVTRSRATR